MTSTGQNEHVLANYRAFVQLLPTIITAHQGQFALMRDGQVVEYFSTFADAFKAGRQLYSDGKISIQEVTNLPLDLGFFSHAVPRG
jgi:hypothetical protein